MNKLPNELPKLINELPNEISLQISPSIELSLDNICWSCKGAGRLRVMQNMAVIGGGSLRGPDTTAKCNLCHGTGRK